MQESERLRLEYRPRIAYKPDLNYLAIREQLSSEAANAYQIPPGLRDAVDNLGSDAVATAQDVQAKAHDLADQLRLCLANSTQGPLAFPAYEQAQKAGDQATVDAYELFHRGDMAGKVQFEAMGAIQRAGDEAGRVVDAALATLFPGASPTDDLDELRRLETDRIDAAIRDDMKRAGTDMTSWQFRAHTARALREQAEGLGQFVADLEGVCRSAVVDQFGESVRPAVEPLSVAPDTALPGITAMTDRRFARAVQTGERARLRMDRLDSQGMRDTLLARLPELQQVYTGTVAPLIGWMADVDTEWDTHPVTVVLDTVATEMELVAADLQRTLVELHKVNRLDRMNREDWTKALLEKKRARQIHKLASTMMEDFDFTDSDRDRQIRRFIENNGLDMPGTLCSQ